MEKKSIYLTIQEKCDGEQRPVKEIVGVSDVTGPDCETIEAIDLDEAINILESRGYAFEDDIRINLENLYDSTSFHVLGTFDIKVSTENRSFNELADMFQEGDIKVPDVQRKFVWDTNKCSKLIESILIGLPIPPLFFMDIGNNSYEVIDGLQRLTAISNYILGNQWGALTNETHRKVAAKLSPIVDESIQGKTFEQLSLEQQKKIKRSTVTVIDFRQIGSEDQKSKYLIFERINTGSELLNPMQIRKALAYGIFMSSLYDAANASEVLKSMFGKQYLNKDKHVEFLLSTYVTYQVLKGEYTLQGQYQKYILNDFCEERKNERLDPKFVAKFNQYLGLLLSEFPAEKIFKKVNQEGEYHGNRSTNISEALVATAILVGKDLPENIESAYKEEISSNNEKFIQNKIILSDLKEREQICRRILGDSSGEE